MSPHPIHRKEWVSKTQTTPIAKIQLFGKDLLNPRSRFTLLLHNENINLNPELDTIIPIENGFNTNKLILKGIFTILTICIYGELAESKKLLLNPSEIELSALM